MTDEERAEAVIRAGVPVPAKDWRCVGCGDVVTIREPGRPAGVHGTVVTVDESGKASKPLDVWAHAKPRCIGGILRVLAGETEASEETEAEPTPIRHRRAKGDTEAAPEEIHARPEVASAVAAGLD